MSDGSMPLLSRAVMVRGQAHMLSGLARPHVQVAGGREGALDVRERSDV